MKLIKCTLPKLFVSGDQDKDTNYQENTVKTYKKCDNAELKIVHGLDHCFIGDENLKISAINYTADFICEMFQQNKIDNEEFCK